jgi:hypothetical protein
MPPQGELGGMPGWFLIVFAVCRGPTGVYRSALDDLVLC